jgi:hypothetical protein
MTFQALPGLYKVQKQQIPQRRFGRVQLLTSFFTASHAGNFKFFPHHNESDFDPNTYLVLGGSLKDVELEGKRVQGIKLFILSPFLDSNQSGYSGHALLEPFLSQSNWAGLQDLPGYYNLTFKDIRGAGGQSISRVVDKQFIRGFDLKSCLLKEPKAG